MRTILVLVCISISSFLLGCAKSANNEHKITPQITPKTNDWRSPYPHHWWQYVDPKSAKSWEILPQKAGFKQVVLSKRNELGLLSNFAETPFVLDGVCYRTLESFWQMMKYPESERDERYSWTRSWKYTRQEVINMNGYQAKSAGNYANWFMDKNDYNFVTYLGKKIVFAEGVPGAHYSLIWKAFLEKIKQNDSVFSVLVKTGDLELLADHGINSQSPKEWHYHILWSEVRDLLFSKQISFRTNEDENLIRECKEKWTIK